MQVRHHPPPKKTGGGVGIITAGTADIPVAEEVGCDVDLIYDAGAAGIHRLFPDLGNLIEKGVDAIVVAAGRDGTLPTVVSGLVPVPVIGLPVSVGYGAGGKGEAALLSMLQSTSMPVLWQARLQRVLRTLPRQRGGVASGLILFDTSFEFL